MSSNAAARMTFFSIFDGRGGRDSFSELFAALGFFCVFCLDDILPNLSLPVAILYSVVYEEQNRGIAKHNGRC
jgi:hypothetical protein